MQYPLPSIWIFYAPVGQVSTLPRTGRAGPVMTINVTRFWGDRLTEYQRLPQKEQGMLDVILLAGGVSFFIISIAYAYGCDHL